MNKRITFRGMDHSDLIEDYANQQLERIFAFIEHEPTPQHVDLILEGKKPHAEYKVELRVKTPHYDLISQYVGPELYPVLERVIDVMYKNLRQAKEKRAHDMRNKDSY